MEEALIARLRGDTDVAAVAGTFGGRPAIDLHERKSDEKSAFPAVIASTIAPGSSYDQAGPTKFSKRVMRFECMALSAGGSIRMKRAIVAALEPAAEVGGVRFHRAKLRFERSFPPEDVATLRIFRTVIDMDIPTTAS